MLDINQKRNLLAFLIFIGVISFLSQVTTLNGDKSPQENLENKEEKKSIVIKKPN